MAVNLLVTLDDERHGVGALTHAHDAARAAGCTLRRVDGSDDRLAAWIDLHFAPSWWSYEVRAGSAWVAERDGEILGFAGFGARGLSFPWLARWRARDGVGIFGPYGVLTRERGRGVAPPLLTAALCALREAGFRAALIPAVSGDALIALYRARAGAAVVERYDYDLGRARAVILASGAGSNARSVLDAVAAGRLPLDVAAVVVNDADAGALQVTREAGVSARAVVWDRARESRAAYDARLEAELASLAPDVVLLLGWMHLLPASFLARFAETLNLHPAFLPLDPATDAVIAPDGSVVPALRGAHAIRDAVRLGVGWSGATMHYVTSETDRGAVLVRVPVPVGEAVSETELREKLRPVEQAVVAAALRRWLFERAAKTAAKTTSC
ncbi:MAG: GNAT family N-acetyltransferase [Candidatus Eremiobacteraeota bacterium]|nr:GNAT family N-acetyltransferase [Candidatus Eremiobacteraeota bacterium]